MKDKANRPSQLDDLFLKIRHCLDMGLYRQSKHAIERELERKIDLPDVLYVLKNGYHEKRKTSFDEAFQTWKMLLEVRHSMKLISVSSLHLMIQE